MPQPHLLNREARALAEIERWEGYNPMFYRTNVHLHSFRSGVLMLDFLPCIQHAYRTELTASVSEPKEVDLADLLYISGIHDHPEIITGDKTLAKKYGMTQEEKMRFAEKERAAIEELYRQREEIWQHQSKNGRSPSCFSNPSLTEYHPETNLRYRKGLYEVLGKNSLEAQIVSFVDKVDGLCEALHELFAGNRVFAQKILPLDGRLVDPIEGYLIILKDFGTKYPGIRPLLEQEHPLLAIPDRLDIERILDSGKPHDIKSIKKESGIRPYELWKKITIEFCGVDLLIEKKE